MSVELVRYRKSVSDLLHKEYAITWSDACGDDEPLVSAIDTGEQPEEFVERFALKYGLTSVHEISWMIGSRTDVRRW